MKKNRIFTKNIRILIAILVIYASIVIAVKRGNFEIKTKISPLVVPVNKVYNATYKLPKGLAFDNKHLWITSSDVNNIYAIDPNTGETKKQITITHSDLWGLEWDGTTLWVVDTLALKIYRLNVTTGDIISSIEAPGALPSGLTWDGSNLWVSDINSHEIFKIDPLSGLVLDVFYAPTPIKNPSGLAWQKDKLWVVDLFKSYLFAIEPDTKQIVEYYYSPGNFPSDVAIGDDYFWVIDYSLSEIYQITPGEQVYKITILTIPNWLNTLLLVVLIPVFLSIINDLSSPDAFINKKEPADKSGAWFPSNFFLIVAVLGSMYTSYELFRIIYSVVILNKPITIGTYSFWLYQAEIFFCIYTLGFWVYYVLIRILRLFKTRAREP